MRAGLVALLLAYVVSQFFRAFLPVLAPVLRAEIGATAEDLSFAAGVWFLVFAVMQVPVGAALDRIGPRRTAAALFALGCGGGALAFAAARSADHVTLAMALIAVGCSPVLMAAYFIFARVYPPRLFATLASAMIGVGSLGNIGGSVPLAWAVTELGWRPTLAGIGLASLLIAAALALAIRDPERVTGPAGGSMLDVLRMPVLWPLLAMMAVNYIPAAALRSLWVGPYVADVFGAGPGQIGQVTLVMGLAMVAGNLAYGPLDRVFGTRKWVVFWGNLLVVGGLVALRAFGAADIWLATGFLALIGLAGSSYGLIIAHARAFIPAHLTGRGVTLMNLVGIGGAGLAQMASGGLYRALQGAGPAAAPYGAIFLLFAVIMALGLLAYLFSRDSTD